MFRSRSSSSASRKFSKKDEPEEPWDYVSFKKIPSSVNSDSREAVQFSFDTNNMPVKSENHKNGSHHNINYEVAKKQELEVIYEYVEPRNNNNRTTMIIIGVVLVILCIGGGVGVALWQMGLFSSDIVTDSSQASSQDPTRDSIDNIKDIEHNFATENPLSSPKFTTTHKVNDLVTDRDLQTTDASSTIKSDQVPSTSDAVLLGSTSTRRTTTSTTTPRTPATTIATESSLFSELTLPTTPFNHFTTEANLIVPTKKRREDNMFMLLTGGIDDLKNDQETGEIIGKRRKGRDEGCQKLESWAPHFTRFIGTAFLSTIDAIVSCGYTHVYEDPSNSFDNYPMTSCFVYYKFWNEWQHVNVIEKVGFYEGSYFSWQNRLVLFGGNAVYGKGTHAITRSITVFEFSAVKDLYGYNTDTEEDDYYGSGDSYGYGYDDTDDDSYEGSADSSDDIEIKVTMVEDADHLLEEYGPGAIESCAVALIDKVNSVSFIVTGGKNLGSNGRKGTTLAKTMKAHLKLDHDKKPVMGREREFLPMMNFARKQHGCAKIFINGQDTMIVAGGSNQHDNPVPEVEFLGLRRITNWKIFGNLNTPRFGFPSVGKVSGKLVVVGGRKYSSSQSDKLDIDSTSENIAKTIEVYDEKLHNFRSAIISDNLGKTSLEITRYNYHGVLFPKSWCHL